MSLTDAVQAFGQSTDRLRQSMDKNREAKARQEKAQEFLSANQNDKRAKFISQDIASGDITATNAQYTLSKMDQSSPNDVLGTLMKKATDPDIPEAERLKAMRSFRDASNLLSLMKQASASGSGKAPTWNDITVGLLVKKAQEAVANGTMTKDEAEQSLVTIGLNKSLLTTNVNITDTERAESRNIVNQKLDSLFKKKSTNNTDNKKADDQQALDALGL